MIVFEKQKTGKTNKDKTNTEEPSTVAAICGTVLDSLLFKLEHNISIYLLYTIVQSKIAILNIHERLAQACASRRIWYFRTGLSHLKPDLWPL